MPEAYAPEARAELVSAFGAAGSLRDPAIPRDGEFLKRFQQGLAFVSEDRDGSPGFILSGEHQAMKRQLHSGESERKKQDRQHMTLTLLERARDWSRQLGQRIDNLERGFEAEMGDAWREQIANEIMDPDEIPQRGTGESMAAYRERLEDALIDKMIDPATGQVRPEYRDDPRLSRYGEWALANYQKREVDAYISRRSDPALSQEQKDEMDRDFAESATGEQVMLTNDELTASGNQPNVLRSDIDDRRAASTSQESAETENAAFPRF